MNDTIYDPRYDDDDNTDTEEYPAVVNRSQAQAAYVSPAAVDQQIAVIIERASQLATVDVGAAWQDIETRMRALYAQAEAAQDAAALEHIQAAYDQSYAVAQNAQAHGETAAAAFAALAILKNQRDQARDDAADMEQELEMAEEYAVDQYRDNIWDNGGLIWEEPEVSLMESLINAPGITETDAPNEDIAGTFMYALANGESLTAAEARELNAFIKDFGGRVYARRQAEYEAYQREARAKWEARRDQRLLEAKTS